jgi:hypothetical protein
MPGRRTLAGSPIADILTAVPVAQQIAAMARLGDGLSTERGYRRRDLVNPFAQPRTSLYNHKRAAARDARLLCPEVERRLRPLGTISKEA